MIHNLSIQNLLQPSPNFLANPKKREKFCAKKGRCGATYAEISQRDTKKLFKFIILLLFVLFGINSAMANNIQVIGSRVIPNTATSAYIEFSLSWENSWRVADLGHGVGNWDAAWVFVKYREVNGDWQHAWLSTNNNDHDPGTGTEATINIGTSNIGGIPRGMGAFIYRSENGSGIFSITNARLQWNYADQGFQTTSRLEIRVFAIEMVYVAEGAFFAGSGGNEIGRFHAGGASNTTPFEVTESWTNQTNGPCMGNTSGCLWGTSTSGNSTIGSSGNLNQTFPTGYHAFYMMKYNITQQQYVDFLNTLTRTQQEARFSNTTVGHYFDHFGTATTPVNRMGVRLMSDPGGGERRVFGCDLNGNGIAGEANDGQWVAMGLSWMDGAAYVDWAGLRPMTELEYEKAARGFANPVPNEYAWGTASIQTVRYNLNNAGTVNEGISSNYNSTGTTGNSNHQTSLPSTTSLQGAMRVGIFAAHALNTGRVTSGASYWGIMELSGIPWERAVTVGNNTGRNFTALHGDGALSAAGHANVPNWSGSGEVRNATGSGFRGADWNSTVAYLRVSDRFSAGSSHSVRTWLYGFRGVRSAP